MDEEVDLERGVVSICGHWVDDELAFRRCVLTLDFPVTGMPFDLEQAIDRFRAAVLEAHATMPTEPPPWPDDLQQQVQGFIDVLGMAAEKLNEAAVTIDNLADGLRPPTERNPPSVN